MPSDPQDFLTGTIDDYLLALADGIVQAQRQLNSLTVETAAGQPPVLYQMPKVDFELKLSFELERETETRPAGAAGRFKRPLLKARPVNTQTTGETLNTQAVSTIKGTFIAVPAHGGKPPPVLALRTLPGEDPAALDVELLLRNTAGQPIAGQTIDLAIDRDFSRDLNTQNGLPAASCALAAGTDFERAQVVTDNTGLAHARLAVDPAEAPGASIVIEAFAGSLSQAVIHQIPARK